MSKGTVEPSECATLQDRIAMKEGRPQVYGTQVYLKADIVGEEKVQSYYLWPVADAEKLDELRVSVGLLPMEMHLQVLKEAIGQIVIWDKSLTVDSFKDMKEKQNKVNYSQPSP